MRQRITRQTATAVPPPRSAHVGSGATDKTRKRGRARRQPSFDDAALPRRARMLTDKANLRRQVRATRTSFAREGHILVTPAFRDRLAPGLIVASYVPIGDEADPAPLAAATVAAGATLALPHIVDRATPLRFLAWTAGEPLLTGPLELRQPDAAAREVAPAIILTPLLAFDRAGNRLGQGAGYYDRAFDRYPAAWRVGIAWSVQQVEAVPIDAWDVPLHAIATEREWIEPS